MPQNHGSIVQQRARQPLRCSERKPGARKFVEPGKAAHPRPRQAKKLPHSDIAKG